MIVVISVKVFPSGVVFQYVPLAENPLPGSYIIVWFVAKYSSETSVIPDTVTCILHVGIVSLCSHGIHAQTTAASTMVLVIPTLALPSRLSD